MYNNFFIQVKGRKQFVLFSPSDWHGLYLFPKHHPHARRSQVGEKKKEEKKKEEKEEKKDAE